MAFFLPTTVLHEGELYDLHRQANFLYFLKDFSYKYNDDKKPKYVYTYS